MPPGGEIAVAAHDDDQWAEVSVRDTGSGIAAEDLPYVFERFYRADKSRSRVTGGAGLALAIARQLVEAHGGRIWVESTEGEGCTFTLALPLTIET
jgi:two-component system sensor histidine kinase BaeS